MEVKITVSDRDVNRIIQIGCKPATKTTEAEKDEFNHLCLLVGTAVCMKILNK